MEHKTSVSTLLAATLLVTAQVAEANPTKKAKPEAKEAFTCSIAKLHIVGSIDPRGWEDYNALVRMSCKNTGKAKVRIDVAHTFLEDEEYEYDASSDIDVFNSFYSNDPEVQFARRYVDLAPGKTTDFALYFEDVNSQWGFGLVLVLSGTKYPLPVLPH